jgi:hypothetical protein
MYEESVYLVAEVQIKEKGGSIHAYSDEIPGLHVVGQDRELVLEDVITAIKFLYKEVKGMAVDVKWADSPATFFSKERPMKNFERFVMTQKFAAAS